MEIENILQIVVYLIAISASLIFGFDFVFYLMDRYCRFHIGRWKTEKLWRNAIEKISLRWVKYTPTVKITDNSRYILLDILLGKYRSKNIQSWQKAALILGLKESGLNNSKSVAQKAAMNLLEDDGRWKKKPMAVDLGMLSYALLRISEDKKFVKPAMDETIDLICNQVNKQGIISYTGGISNPEMYVDTLGLTCPFLAAYAHIYAKPEMEELAFHQLEMFHTYGLHITSNLPNHAFNIESKLPLGVYGWGRGTGWYLIGLMDALPFIEREEFKEKIKLWIQEAAESYLKFQRTDGGFGGILQRMDTYDSSATAVLAWFYAGCAELFECKNYERVAKRSINKLMSVTRITGALDFCQGDTKGIGIFSQTYDIMPFAQGMTLRALRKINSEKFT